MGILCQILKHHVKHRVGRNLSLSPTLLAVAGEYLRKVGIGLYATWQISDNSRKLFLYSWLILGLWIYWLVCKLCLSWDDCIPKKCCVVVASCLYSTGTHGLLSFTAPIHIQLLFTYSSETGLLSSMIGWSYLKYYWNINKGPIWISVSSPYHNTVSMCTTFRHERTHYTYKIMTTKRTIENEYARFFPW